MVEKGGELITGTPTRMSSTGLLGLVLAMLVIGVLGGACSGLAQWLYLRRHSDATLGWVGNSMLALTAGLLTGLAIASLIFGGVTTAAGGITFLACTGVVFGGLTARALPRVPATG